MPAAEDDLLRPTLAVDLDVQRMSRPFDPSSLIWAAFLGGPLGGGPLYALNYRRLGRPIASRNALVLSVLVGVGAAFAAAWVVRAVEQGAVEWTNARHGVRVLGLVLGYALAHDQRKSFRAYEASGSPVGKALWPSVVAIAAGAALQAGLVFAAVELA